MTATIDTPPPQVGDLVTPTGVLVSPVTDSSDPAWHAARAKGLGSSDAAAVLGLDPWNSAYGLWLSKTGRVTDDRESEPMKWGKVLEGPIAEEFGAREGLRVLPAPGVLARDGLEWLLASPDRMLASPDDPRPFSFVEVKNVSAWKGGDWDAEAGLMPPHYLVQVMHQLAVTGYDEASVACLVGGQRLEYLTVQRDEALIDQILLREQAFWDLVQSDTEPAWDGHERSVEAVRAYRAEPGRVIDLSDEHLPLLADVRAAKAVTAEIRARLKEAEKVEKAAVGALQAVMGTAEVALFEGEPVCTWKEAQRKGYVVEAGTVRTFRLS